MATKELVLGVLQGVTPLAEIPDVSVQQFCFFLQKKFPKATIKYEPTTFTYTDSAGKKRQTSPDVFFRKYPGAREAFIEITRLPRNGAEPVDPKKKQREIMASYPGINYYVLYRENLEKIEKAARRQNIPVSFFSARKVRE